MPAKEDVDISPTKRLEAALRHQQSFDDRKAELRQNDKIDDQYMEEYSKTEIIRQSISDVKKRAEEEKKRRESPGKTYGGVRSSIAKNMKAQKSGKKIQNKEDKMP